MRYLLLIYGPESDYEVLPAAVIDRFMSEHYALMADARAAGVYVTSERLHDVKDARSVRLRDGEHLVFDGPFAETKEQLGGFYILETATIEEAIAWAKRIPQTPNSIVEVRPIA